MKTLKSKTMAISIAIFLMLSMSASIMLVPNASAAYDNATQTAINQGMNWSGQSGNASTTRLLLWSRFGDKIPTWVFLMAAPNPVGVGQPFNLVMFNPQVPPNAATGNDVRYQYTMDVVKPNGDTETLPSTGTFISDPTGSTYSAYTADQVGNYSFTLHFQQLFYHWNSTTGGDSSYYGTTFLASYYTLKVAVQQEPVSLIGMPNISPLPTQYWTRPIEGQNTDWYQVSSNWLGNAHDLNNGGSENRYQADGTAPNSPHILWTRPNEDNGVVGGNISRIGNVFNAGSQYQPRFTSQIIMYGRLYYTPNIYYTGTSEMMDCVDLKTGQLLYEVNTTGVGQFSFGYQYNFDDPNEHGIVNPGWIFTNNYARAYQPALGIATTMNITGVPSGFELMGPAGENLRFVLTNLGTTANPNYYLAQWNSSNVVPTRANPSSTMINASLPSRYDWNVSMPIAFTTPPTVRAAKLGDILWGSNGSWPTGTSGPSYAYPQNVTIWAISLKTASLGQLIYIKTIDVDNVKNNTNIMFERASGAEGVFVGIEVPTCKFFVYSIATGDKLFETDAQADVSAYGYFTWPSLISVTQTKLAYGMLYTAGYTGFVSAYNLTTGKLVWRQTAPSGGEKIQNYVLMEGLICDGKIYVGTHEHSADTPLYKGERVRCLNATTGDVIWTMSGWAYPESFATADGVLIYWNNYDGQIYAIGQGPTSMTVTAPDTAAPLGTPVLIRGTVTDVSAGTTQQAQKANFPNGVPCVSDASMSEWMEYVYMQKAKPTNVTGVPVSLDVIDSNGNYRNIGTATSDASGTYSFAWTPDITGKYTVIATFAGTNGYWPSSSETAFDVMQAAPTPAPTATPQSNLATTTDLMIYMAASVIAIIIAIAIVGLLMLRKRPVPIA